MRPCFKQAFGKKREITSMRHVIGLALAASVSAIALGSVGNAPARAADMATSEYGYQQQPAYYPPQQPTYYPPQQAEAYPPPPPVAYYAYPPAPVVVAPYPYYLRAPYWHGYAPRVAYGYGHWGRGYRRW
jgi:hypothetical protein